MRLLRIPPVERQPELAPGKPPSAEQAPERAPLHSVAPEQLERSVELQGLPLARSYPVFELQTQRLLQR